jgi:hypothetical protein
MQREIKEGRVCHLKTNLISCLQATLVVLKGGSIKNKRTR